MTREEILATYQVNADGIITSPGKFEGEALYVPAFYNGGADEELSWPNTEQSTYLYFITTEDSTEWPELKDVFALNTYESDQGFAFCDTLSLQEYRDLIAENDKLWYEHHEENEEHS